MGGTFFFFIHVFASFLDNYRYGKLDPFCTRKDVLVIEHRKKSS